MRGNTLCFISPLGISCVERVQFYMYIYNVRLSCSSDFSGSYVFTASLDGTIVKWNLQKLTFAQPKIELTNIKSLRSLRMYKDKMLCGKLFISTSDELNTIS